MLPALFVLYGGIAMRNAAVLVFLIQGLVGCAGMNTRSPVPGFLYSDVQFTHSATSNQAGNRIGEACALSILGLISTGDASIEAARRNGGITLISGVDETFNNYLGLYSKSCVVVRGR